MATQGYEIPTEFRDFSEKGVEQARTAFGYLVSNAVKASEQLRSTGETVQSTLHSAVLKGIDNAQVNAAATFDYAQKIVRARDPREAFEIHQEFVKSQFAALQAQAKEFGSLVQTNTH